MYRKVTVARYINARDSIRYNKRIRVLDYDTHTNKGSWIDNEKAYIKAIKVTPKYIFIFI